MSSARDAVRAWLVGLGVLIAAALAWVVSVANDYFSPVLLAILWLSPVIASALIAYLSPARKLLMGVLTTIPALACALVINTAFQMKGQHVDFPGAAGAVALVVASIIWMLPVCALGGAIGFFISKRKQSMGGRSLL